MTTSQVVAEYERRATSGRTILMAAVFAIGAMAGIAAQGTLDRATEHPVVAPPAPIAVDATAPDAGRPVIAPAVKLRDCPCATRDTMSDAAYAAMHPSLPSRRTRQRSRD